MNASITIGQKDGKWKAIILEGNGTREDDAKTIIELQGSRNATEKALVAQLPAKYRKAIQSGDATLVMR